MSAQVDFYILENPDSREKHKYACRIVQKAYSRGLRVYVHMDDPAQCEQLDSLLWTFSQGSFIPHSICSDKFLDWNDFPVQIGESGADDIGASILVNLRTEVSPAYNQFERVVELVGADPADKASARDRFRYYREHGLEPETHNV
jgi:DNA polymerase-3 subunit chi